MLINFERHPEWLFKEVKIRFPFHPLIVVIVVVCFINWGALFFSMPSRPKSGSMLLYSRKKVRYRRDGYCWKKRKDGKTTREDHMKLKVQGTEVSLCYVILKKTLMSLAKKNR